MQFQLRLSLLLILLCQYNCFYNLFPVGKQTKLRSYNYFNFHNYKCTANSDSFQPERETESVEKKAKNGNSVENSTSNKLIDLGYCQYGPPNADRRISKREILLIDEQLEEKFVRSTGKGGQKVNKSSSRVQLKHIPSGICVHCQEARDLSTNRKWARKALLEKLDFTFNTGESKTHKIIEQKRKRKKNATR